MKLSKYEQETIINFNAGERNATLYTRDRKVMKEMDVLVSRYPEVYHLDCQTNIDKTYSFSKSCVKYRKPRTLSEAQREQKRERIKQLNGSITNGEIPS
ncbi:MAG: hypothetical protein IKF90_09530 [Parasporobacterium sp.]|jgi:hypothetical protein|nr:hypothetical protein [Parasporobacterium sp.]